VGQVIGKTGKVVAVDSDGDLKVDFGGKTWILNPQCCVPVSQGVASPAPSARPSLTINTENNDDDDDDNNNSQ